MDYDLQYAIDLSKTIEISKYNAENKIPEYYRVPCKLLNIYERSDFDRFIQKNISKFNLFIFRSIICSIQNQDNNEKVCKIYRIGKYHQFQHIYYMLKTIAKKKSNYSKEKFNDLCRRYCETNNIPLSHYVILKKEFLNSIKFFHGLVDKITENNIIFRIEKFI